MSIYMRDTLYLHNYTKGNGDTQPHLIAESQLIHQWSKTIVEEY